MQSLAKTCKRQIRHDFTHSDTTTTQKATSTTAFLTTKTTFTVSDSYGGKQIVEISANDNLWELRRRRPSATLHSPEAVAEQR